MVKSQKSRVNGERGISLIEILVAVIIFIVGVTSIALIYLNSVTASFNNLEETRAIFLAQEGLEAVKSIRDDSFYNLSRGDYQLALTGNKWELVSADGLVGHWQLNGNAIDSSGYDNHGTIYGATPAEDRRNLPRGALSFDGEDNYVEVPDKPDWALTDFTIELWANLATLTQGNWWTAAFVAQDEGGGATNKWIFSWDSSIDKLVLHVNTPGGNPNFVINSNVFSATIDTWYHISLVRSGDDYTFYKDGTAIGSVTQAGTIPDAATPLTIGWGEGSGGFNGLIDDVRIYNRALSAEEIQNLYNVYEGRYKREITISDVDDDLVGHWKLDGHAIDSSGNNNHGTIYGAISAIDRKGIADSALSFDGVDDYVRVNPSSVFAFGTGNYTISQWVYVAQQSDVQSNAGLVSNYLAAACSWFTELKPGASYTYGFYGCAGHKDSGVTITYGQWAHFVVAREGTGANQAKMYVNGVLVANFTDAYNYTVTTNKLWLGNINFDAYPTTYRFNGFIDEVRIYNRALSEREIKLLYEEGKYLIKSNVSWQDPFFKREMAVELTESISNI